jgi:hypothetical protein
MGKKRVGCQGKSNPLPQQNGDIFHKYKSKAVRLFNNKSMPPFAARRVTDTPVHVDGLQQAKGDPQPQVRDVNVPAQPINKRVCGSKGGAMDEPIKKQTDLRFKRWCDSCIQG